MTASRLVTIFCDAPSCGVWWDRGIAETATKARAGLKGHGWTLARTGSDGVTRDYCPRHRRDR